MEATTKQLNNLEALENVQKEISAILRMKLPKEKYAKARWMKNLEDLREVENNIWLALQNEEAN